MSVDSSTTTKRIALAYDRYASLLHRTYGSSLNSRTWHGKHQGDFRPDYLSTRVAADVTYIFGVITNVHMSMCINLWYQYGQTHTWHTFRSGR